MATFVPGYFAVLFLQMKYKFILISALMLLGVEAAAQTAGGRITGIVVDEVEDSPLTGATILIQELKRGEVADFDGKFSFQDLPEGVRRKQVLGYPRNAH